MMMHGIANFKDEHRVARNM